MPCYIGLWAEQSAIAEMLKKNETVIKTIIAVFEDGSILPPCGRSVPGSLFHLSLVDCPDVLMQKIGDFII